MEKRDTALIAGASSGIGRAYAAEFARRGYDLIITGRGKDLLRNIAAELAARHSVKVNAVIAELSNDRDLEALSRKAGKTKSLTVLVNNAGFGAMRDFLGEGYAAQEALLKIHSLAPVKLIYAALSGMRSAGRGIIINVCSLSARAIAPVTSMYSATKAFLLVFSEALHLEHMEDGILIQALCPGFTHTDFHGKIRWPESAQKNRGILRWMTPEKLVAISLRN